MRRRAWSAWSVPAALGLVVVAVFLLLVAASDTLRRNWPLLVLPAAAVAATVLLRGSPTERPPTPPVARGDGDGTADGGTAGDAAGADGDGEVTDAGPVRPAALLASGVTVPKASATGGENEDAYAIDAGSGYLALADGASSSFRAADWARALCDTFLARRPLRGHPSTSWIGDAAAAFGEGAGPGSDWWSADAALRGAHAAFAGLAVTHTGQGLGWRATAVGDCVLVHLRQDAAGPPIVTAFPIAHSAAFPQNPALLSSATDGHPPVASIDGVAAVGDVWLLMTDELARWALRRHEAGDAVWTELAGGSEADVRDLVTRARADEDVADDDMTVVRCEAVAAG